MTTRKNIPAFPTPVAVGPAGDVYPGEGGMSLRDYFAGQALAALASRYNGNNSSEIVRSSYWLADTALVERDAK